MIRGSIIYSCVAVATCLTSVTALGANPTAPDLASMQELVEQIKHPMESPERTRAIEALVQYGAPAAPLFQEMLGSADDGVRYAGCIGIMRLGRLANCAAEDLIRIVANPNDSLRSTAIAAIAEIGADANLTAPLLREIVMDENSPDRQVALFALKGVGRQGAKVLAEVLEQRDIEYRRLAASELRQMGAEALPAASALARATNDSDEIVCDTATMALAVIGPEAEATLIDLLGHDNAATRRRAVMAICHLRPVASDLVDPLVARLTDSDSAVRFWAAKALGEANESTTELINSLVKALGDSDPDVRWQATASLVQIGAEEAARESLRNLLYDPNPVVRTQVRAILGRSPAVR